MPSTRTAARSFNRLAWTRRKSRRGSAIRRAMCSACTKTDPDGARGCRPDSVSGGDPLRRGHGGPARTDAEPLNPVQEDGDDEDDGDLEEGVAPEIIDVGHLLQEQQCVDVQDEGAERLLPECDEHDLQTTRKRPPPRQQSVSERQRDGEIHETADAEIRETEVPTVDGRETIGRDEVPMHPRRTCRPWIAQREQEERDRRHRGGDRKHLLTFDDERADAIAEVPDGDAVHEEQLPCGYRKHVLG